VVIRRCAAVLVLALTACGNRDESARPAADAQPAAAPQKTEVAAPAPASTSAEPAAKPAPAPAEEAAKPADPAPSAQAEAPSGAAMPGSAAAPPAQGKAPAAALAPAPAPALAKAGPLPKAPNGILPPGEADKILKAGARPTVKLLEPGQAPQADLSYALTKGRQGMGVRLDMSMGMTVGSKSIPATPVPQVVMMMDVGVGDRDASGDWKVDGTVTQIRLEPKGPAQEQIAGALRPQMGALEGLSISHLINAKGHVHGLTTKLPPGLPPNAEQMMTALSQSYAAAPLPAEPVGPGARWQVVMRINNASMDILQFATYTLRSRDGARVSLDVSIDQLACSTSMTAPGMPPGVTAKLRSFQSRGGGSSQVDLASVAPDKGQMNVKTSLDIDVSAGAGAPAEKSHVDTIMNAETFRPAK